MYLPIDPSCSCIYTHHNNNSIIIIIIICIYIYIYVYLIQLPSLTLRYCTLSYIVMCIITYQCVLFYIRVYFRFCTPNKTAVGEPGHSAIWTERKPKSQTRGLAHDVGRSPLIRTVLSKDDNRVYYNPYDGLLVYGRIY